MGVQATSPGKSCRLALLSHTLGGGELLGSPCSRLGGPADLREDVRSRRIEEAPSGSTELGFSPLDNQTGKRGFYKTGGL